MSETPATHQCSVLVVDDDPEVCELLRVALVGAGYAMSWAANGRDALNHLRSHTDTCIILLDLILPVMDGVGFRNAQLHDRALAWIPVVLMSGAPDAERHAREMGARFLVRKPLDLDEVMRTVKSIGCSQTRPRRSPAPRGVK
jgi:CheY-like chemotaxis protein